MAVLAKRKDTAELNTKRRLLVLAVVGVIAVAALFAFSHFKSSAAATPAPLPTKVVVGHAAPPHQSATPTTTTLPDHGATRDPFAPS